MNAMMSVPFLIVELILKAQTSHECRFHYGAPSDYDEWATLQRGQSGAAGWSYEQFHP